jgi:AbrB family looped-hinge helix DNA binding protein
MPEPRGLSADPWPGARKPVPAPLIVRLFRLTLTSTRGQPMSTLTVTAKGQVTLRKDLLKHLGIQPGEKITVDKLPDGRIEVKAARPTGKISDVFDFLKREDGPSLSIEEINNIAARGWAGRR